MPMPPIDKSIDWLAIKKQQTHARRLYKHNQHKQATHSSRMHTPFYLATQQPTTQVGKYRTYHSSNLPLSIHKLITSEMTCLPVDCRHGKQQRRELEEPPSGCGCDPFIFHRCSMSWAILLASTEVPISPRQVNPTEYRTFSPFHPFGDAFLGNPSFSENSAPS